MFNAKWAHEGDIRIETKVYGEEHENLLREMGIENLDVAHKTYESYEGNSIEEKIWPYYLSKGSKEQALIASDLEKMITEWKPGQREQDYYIVKGSAIPPDVEIDDFPENTIFTYDLFNEDEDMMWDDEDWNDLIERN